MTDATRQASRDVLEVPWNLVIPEVDIYLVGYGNRLPNDLTLELLAVMQRCKRRFGLPPIHAPDFKVPPMESLLHLFSPDKHRRETYREIVDIVLAAARADPPVALATYGSAMVGTLPAHRIHAAAGQAGLTVHVTNAPSFYDCLWADFNIDACLGFETWEASLFLRAGISPNRRAHLVLALTPFMDVASAIDPPRIEFMPGLRDRLLEFYPPEHEVHLATTGARPGDYFEASTVETVVLRDLDHSGGRQPRTLLVPRLEPVELDCARPPAAALEWS